MKETAMYGKRQDSDALKSLSSTWERHWELPEIGTLWPVALCNGRTYVAVRWPKQLRKCKCDRLQMYGENPEKYDILYVILCHKVRHKVCGCS